MIKDKILPLIESKFNAAERNAIEGIIKHFDKNHQYYYTANIHQRPLFSDEDRDVIYMAIQSSEAEISEILKASKTFDETRNVSGNPFYCLCALIAGYCLKKNKKETAVTMINYMSANMYVSLHYKYFEFNANKNVMEFTINKLDDSFILKKLGTIYALLEDNSLTCVNKYANKLTRMTDNDVQEFVAAVSTRLNAKMKKLSRQYYANKESGAYFNMDTESHDPDNYMETSNDSYVISKLSDKVYLQLINGKMNMETVKYASLKSDISTSTLENLIKDIIDNLNDGEELRKFISSIIEHFIYYDRNTVDLIGRGKFIDTMASAYASNTNSTQIQYIKETMDEWLDIYSQKYGRGRYGKTAKAGYKKSVYMFFVYTVHIAAK